MPEIKKPTFEQAYGRLEKILESIGSGTLSIEESMKLYEEADKLLAFCNDYLSGAQLKIEKLIKGRDGAEPTREPFATPLGEAHEPLSTTRSD